MEGSVLLPRETAGHVMSFDAALVMRLVIDL